MSLSIEQLEADQTPSRILAEQYRRNVAEGRDGDQLMLITYRGGREEFEIGQEYSRSDDPQDRAVGADILGRLGWTTPTFLEESVAILIPMLKSQLNRALVACTPVAESED